MKYKVLIAGKNKSVMDDFFTRMTEDFDVLSSSTRYMDILQHINYLVPDVFVYCANHEEQDPMSQEQGVQHRLDRLGIPTVLIGTKADCEDFLRNVTTEPDLILYRPLSAGAIHDKLMDFLEEREIANRKQPFAENMEDTLQILSELEAAIPPPSRKHVLVVDDDPMMLKTIKEQLHDEYDVATAVNGKIAMKFLERKTTDIILLDFEMPEENGPAVLKKLRAAESTKDVPVVFLTGVTDRGKIQEALSLRPQGYLVKPIDRDKLLEAIHNNIG
ncbi:MAG: response regulator [Clostridium sp.]|nr:response regulator [Acetatifactor muris]MCM1527716.1 response regulator [Bacteroides sp.]MCM1563956.1 response regulator [Clostridium sp.]